MTRRSGLQRNRWVWSVPVLLVGVVYIAVAYGASLLVAQEQEPVRPMGGIGGMVGGITPTITWVKPQGEKPDWLTRGENALRAREKMRRKLDQEGEFKFDNQPLGAVVSSISDMHGFEIHLNNRGLEDGNSTPEEPITIKTKGSLRSVLRRILDPLNLDYVVHEDYLEITSGNGAPYTVLAYNLAHVADNSSEGESIFSAIKSMVNLDEWGQGGGNASCHLVGSVLLVKVSERAHEEIETVLALLNTVGSDEKK